MLDSENEASRKEIENLNKLLEEKKANEAAVSLKLENLKISHQLNRKLHLLMKIFKDFLMRLIVLIMKKRVLTIR